MFFFKKKIKFRFPISLSLLNIKKWSDFFDKNNNKHQAALQFDIIKNLLAPNINLKAFITSYIIILNRTISDNTIKEEMLKQFLYCFLIEFRHESDIVKECSNILKDF